MLLALSIVFIACAIGYLSARAIQSKRRGLLALEPGGLFSPWSVNLLHWVMIVGMILLLPNNLYPLTSRFWLSLGLWIPILGLTAWFANAALPAHQRSQTSIRTSPIGFDALLLIALVLTPLYLLKIYHQVQTIEGESLMANLRILALQERDNGIVAYCVVINQVLFVASAWAGKTIARWKRIVPAVLYLLCTLAIMEKGGLVFMVIIWMLAGYEQGHIRKKHIAYAAAALVVLGAAFTLQRSTSEQAEIQKKQGLEWFVNTYLLSSPVAYCYMPESEPQELGGNTFTVFYHIANRLHIGHHKVERRVQEFIHVPVETNTYTVFQPFYLDFGQGGVAFFAFVYGLLLGVCYRYFRNGSTLGTLLYAYLIALFCLQFHQEEIFSGMMRLIQYAFFSLIICLPPLRQGMESK